MLEIKLFILFFKLSCSCKAVGVELKDYGLNGPVKQIIEYNINDSLSDNHTTYFNKKGFVDSTNYCGHETHKYMYDKDNKCIMIVKGKSKTEFIYSKNTIDEKTYSNNELLYLDKNYYNNKCLLDSSINLYFPKQIITSRYYMKYDKYKRLIESQSFIKESISGTTKYYYDKKNLVSSIFYSRGDSSYYETTKYNANNYISEEKSYLHGKMNNFRTRNYFYDKRNNWIKCEIIEKFGEKEFKEIRIRRIEYY